MSSWHWAIRIAGWIALAVIIAIAFHYAKKYEAEMLTDAPPPVRATYAAAERISQPENLGHIAPKSGAGRCGNTGQRLTTTIDRRP
jgi:hypothetical protein